MKHFLFIITILIFLISCKNKNNYTLNDSKYECLTKYGLNDSIFNLSWINSLKKINKLDSKDCQIYSVIKSHKLNNGFRAIILKSGWKNDMIFSDLIQNQKPYLEINKISFFYLNQFDSKLRVTIKQDYIRHGCHEGVVFPKWFVIVNSNNNIVLKEDFTNPDAISEIIKKVNLLTESDKFSFEW